MNNELSKLSENFSSTSENEENLKSFHNASNDNNEKNEENFTILEDNPQDMDKENINAIAKENLSAPMEQSHPNEKRITNSIQNESNNSNSDPMYANMLNFLKTVQDNSYSNDENSIKFFEETIPNYIYTFLASNMMQSDIKYLKLIFTFFVNYVEIRINHIESISNKELFTFFKIFELNFPFYMNMGNNPAYSHAEFFENFLRDIWTASHCDTLEKSNKLLAGEFKNLNSCVNYLYKYLLSYLLHTNFFQFFIRYLNSSTITLDYEKFYYIYHHLASLIYFYDNFDKDLIIELITAINNYYGQMFLNNQIKEINKNTLENFLKQSLYFDFCLLEKFSTVNETIEQNALFVELLMKDMNTIYFLVNSQNLERRVLGIKSINDVIQNIYAYEKCDEQVNKQANVSNPEFLNRLILIKKQKMIEWLEKINVFNIIIGENMHEAILRKSSLILIFLYVNGKLPFEQIDYIWKIAQDKHEAISASILNIFSDLISSFSIEHAMHILKIINDIPFKDVGDVTIKILDSFSNNKYLIEHKEGENAKIDQNLNFHAINNINPDYNLNINQNVNDINTNFDFLLDTNINSNTKDVEDFKAYYLKIIWKYSSENAFYSGLSPQIIYKSRKVISSILLKPVFKYDLGKYIKKCILGIGYNHTVTTCLSILDLILKNMKQSGPDSLKDILTSFGNEILDYKMLLNYLDKQYSLVSTVLHSMINVKNEILIISGEIMNMQNSIACLNDEKITLNINEVMNSQEIKFSEPNEKIYQNLKMELKEEANANYNFSDNYNNDINTKFRQEKNSAILGNILDESNALKEFDVQNHLAPNSDRRNMSLIMTENNNNNLMPNLDETLSTEKSFDNSLSTISTDISAIEKSRMFIVKDFLENNLNSINPMNIKAQLLEDNYHVIFKRLKMNFSNANYYTVINSLLEFFKYIIFSSSIQITQTHIEYLYTLLVENSVEEDEMNLFYSFFAEIFRHQMITKQIYLSEENFKFILFDILLKTELPSLPFSAFNLFKQMFFYINSSLNNITIIGQNIFDVRDFSQLIGFETLWKFYIETKNFNVSNDSQGLLVNLISTIAKREDNKESFLLIFEKIFENLLLNLEPLKEIKKEAISRSGILNTDMMDMSFKISAGNKQAYSETDYEERTNKLINILFIINSTRQKFEKKVQEVTLSIQNFYNSDGRISIDLQCSLDTKIKDLKAILIRKILFPQNPQEVNNYIPLIDDKMIMLITRGQILNKEDLTLRCAKLSNGSKIQLHKGESTSMDVQIEEERLSILVATIKTGMDNLEDEVIRRALKKYNYDADETFMALIDEMIVADIRAEIREDNVIVIDDVQSKFGVELFTEDKLNLLISLLDLESVSITKHIWQLLSAIKFPEKLISALSETDTLNFKFIFDVENPNKMLINLRIINCLVFNDNSFTNVAKLDENKRNEWKMNLLISNGAEIMLNTCISIIEIISNDSNANYCMMSSYIQGINIISKWLHYFTFSAALSLSQNRESLSWIIKQIINKRPQGVQIGISYIANNINDQKSNNNATPTFGSPHSSFSAGDKKHAKSFSIQGAEEYENNYEEEIVNSFFVKLITSSFHLSIIKFIIFASNQYCNENFHSENEIAFTNLMEVLIILNEMNPESFKETIIIEYEKSIIINLLFVERSKFVRKIVENLFIILSQTKSIDSLILSSEFIIPSMKKKENSCLRSIKEIIMNHVLNNYKRIYSGQVYEEFFNLFGFMLLHTCDGRDSNSWEKIFGEEFKVNDLAFHILTAIYHLSIKYDTDLSEIELEQLNGNIYLFQCLSTNNESVVTQTLDKFSEENKLNIINFFYDNLFYIEKNEAASYSYESIRFKYSSRNLRLKVYNLLISLSKINPICKKDLSSRLITHHTSFKNENYSKLDLDSPVRHKGEKFIGLKNYGATCYLNSLIQQLYMIPAFRKGIHSVPVLDNKQIFEKLEDNPMYQLQLVFANLSYSIKQYHLPMHFIQSFKAFNNEPINVFKQQDCLEFFLILNDHLENIAKEVSKEHIFDDSIRGKLTTETISLEKDYPYYSEREEPFLSISLDIKNKKSLEEALDLFVKPEVLEGENKYYCEQYARKISIMRRLSIKKMPPYVTINLKRFELDYNTFERIKLNDYCEFPTVIDFKSWTRAFIVSQSKEDPNFKDLIVDLDDNEKEQYNTPDAFKYQLTGVLVHSGSIDLGHYYSFIYDIKTAKWHRYDDSKISEFSINNLKAECFGEDNSNNSDFSSRSNNAYLLFYTKVSEISNYDVEEKVSQNILDQIKEENMQFLKYKNFLDNDYYMFLKEFLDYSILKTNKVEKLSVKEKSMSKIDRLRDHSYELTLKEIRMNELNINEPEHFEKIKNIFLTIQERLNKDLQENKTKSNPSIISERDLQKKLIKMGVYFYFDIIIQQKDIHRTNSYANFLRELLQKDRTTVAWFIKKLINNSSLFVELILSSNRLEIRESFSRIIINCLHSLYTEETKYLREKYSYLTISTTDPIGVFLLKHEYRSCLMRFFKNNILDLFDNTRLHWSTFTQFLQIILECFNQKLFELYELAMEDNLYDRLIYLLMNNQKNYETNYPSIGTKALEPNYILIIEILSSMTMSGVTPGIFNLKKFSPNSKYQNNNHIINIPEISLNLILGYDVFISNIIRKYSNESIQKMIHHLCWGDLEVSIKIINYIIATTKENLKDINSVASLLKNSAGFLQIDDVYYTERVNLFFCLDDISESENDSIFNYLMSYRDDFSLSVVICLKFLGDYILKHMHISNYVINYNQKIVWIYYFVKDITSNPQKFENLEIEAMAESYNMSDLISSIEDMYLNSMKLRNLVNLPNQDGTFSNNRDFQNDNEMALDFEKEIECINRVDDYPLNSKIDDDFNSSSGPGQFK